MRKSDIKNKKLMAAITLGITAMMSMATPISAYASEADPEEGGSSSNEPQTEQSSTQEAVEEHESVTEEAQEQADTVQEAATDAADSALHEASDAAAQILDGDPDSGVDPITPGEAGTITDEAIDDLTQAAEEITQDKVDDDGFIDDPSAATSLQNASDTMDEVKTVLHEADTNNANADKAAKDISEQGATGLENGTQAIQTAEAIKQDTVDAEKKAEDLVNAINNAESSEDAEKAFNDLQKAVSNTESSIADKKAYYDRLMDNYNKAMDELEKAEKALDQYENAYSQNIDTALAKAESAEKDIAAAQAKVDNLAQALKNVEDSLVTEAQQATKVADAFDHIDNDHKDWTDQRALMEESVVNYIIPQLEGGTISNVTWEHVYGFDRQDNNYDKVTYTNEDGKTVTRYFNFDRLNRSTGPDRYKDLGWSWGIAAYEKTQEEIDADNFLREQFASESFYTKTHIPGKPKQVDGKAFNDLKARANAGEFDVFSYMDSTGKTVMMTRAMLNDAIASGDIKDDGGVMTTRNGAPVKQIIQNSNSLLHNGNAYLLSNYNDISTGKYSKTVLTFLRLNHTEEEAQAIHQKLVDANKDYNDFLDFARGLTGEDGEVTHILADKYEKYETAVEKAQEAVSIAQDEAGKLTDAIQELKDNAVSRKILAVDALGVDDLATYFGIEVDPERAEALNNMTVQEAMNALQEFLDEANQIVEDAQDTLDELKEGLTKAKADLEAVKNKFATSEDGENGPSGDGVTGPSADDSRPSGDATSSGGSSAPQQSGTTGTTGAASGTSPAATNTSTATNAAGGSVNTAADAGAPGNAGTTGNAGATAGGNANNSGINAGGGNTNNSGNAGAGNGIAAANAAGPAGAVLGEGRALDGEEAATSFAQAQSQATDEATQTITSENENNESQGVTFIDDDEIPKSDMPIDQDGMGWWWTLLVFLLGDRGRRMYMKHKKNMIIAEDDADKDDMNS